MSVERREYLQRVEDHVSRPGSSTVCRTAVSRWRKNVFGLFADSSPDRWGRLLMTRRERILAEQEGRKPRKLLDSDFLMGVYSLRSGSIRTHRFAEFAISKPSFDFMMTVPLHILWISRFI